MGQLAFRRVPVKAREEIGAASGRLSENSARVWEESPRSDVPVADRYPVDISPAALFASMLVGTVGMAVFGYGKKQQRLPQVVGGLTLMIFPAFVGSALWMTAIAGSVMAGVWLAVRAGY